jgi:hypothetical protein
MARRGTVQDIGTLGRMQQELRAIGSGAPPSAPSIQRPAAFERRRRESRLATISEAGQSSRLRSGTVSTGQGDHLHEMRAQTSGGKARRGTVQDIGTLGRMQQELRAIGSGSGSGSSSADSHAAFVAATSPSAQSYAPPPQHPQPQPQSRRRSVDIISHALKSARRGTARDIGTLGRMQQDLRGIQQGGGLGSSAPLRRPRLSTASSLSETDRIHRELAAEHDAPPRRVARSQPRQAPEVTPEPEPERAPAAKSKKKKKSSGPSASSLARKLRKMSEPPNTIPHELFAAARKSGAILLVTPRNRKALGLVHGSPVVWRDGALDSWVATRCASKPDSEWFIKVNVLGGKESLWTKCGHFGNQLFAIKKSSSGRH